MAIPERRELNADELEALRRRTEEEQDAEDRDDRMDDRMDEDGPSEDEREPLEAVDLGRIPELMYHKPGEVDPYITNVEEDEEDELDDLTVRATDSLLIAARTEDELSHVEVYLYEGHGKQESFYVHHDVMMSAFPLCVEWVGSLNGQSANLFAVGTFNPEIEIWNLDVIDELDPVCKLGGTFLEKRPGKKRRRAKKSFLEGSHRDGVMSVSWNRQQVYVLSSNFLAQFAISKRNVLASGSADSTVKIWDLEAGKCSLTLEGDRQAHRDKVSVVSWSGTADYRHLLLSGSYDKSVAVSDVTGGTPCMRWQFEKDIEAAKWDPHMTNRVFVSLEKGGGMLCCDISLPGAPVFQLAGERKTGTIHDIALDAATPGLLAAVSDDGYVSVWDVSEGIPALVLTQKCEGMGKLFACAFCDGRPGVLAIGGSKGSQPLVIPLFDNSALRRRFIK